MYCSNIIYNYFEFYKVISNNHPFTEPKCMSTNIIWKEGIQPLGQTQESSTNSPIRKRKIESKSFFKWFRDNTDPVTDDIAEIFKDDIWNNPLHYYLVPDIESNDAASSPSDNSDIEEPRRREKTERVVIKPSQINRAKASINTNTSSVSEIPSGAGVVSGGSNENRSAELSGTCDGRDTSETGNVGSGENESGTTSTSGTSSGGTNSSGTRRRLFMSGDYGEYYVPHCLFNW